MDIPRVFISAGELSGDIVGARLVAELRRRDPRTRFAGTGGARLAAAGVEIIHGPTHDIGVDGVTEVAKTAPRVIAAYRAIRRELRANRFDVAVLIGNDVFNTFLGRWLRRCGIPTVSSFPPQAWVWRSLARWMAPSFDMIAASFPDEHAVYSRAAANRPVCFVGHYLADDLQPVDAGARQAARRELGLPAESRVVALLPGSRGDELAALTQVLLDAASLLADRDPALRFVAANAVGTSRLPEAVARHAIAGKTQVSADSHAVIRSADLASSHRGPPHSKRRSLACRWSSSTSCRRSRTLWSARRSGCRIDRGVCRRPAKPPAPPQRGARGVAGARGRTDRGGRGMGLPVGSRASATDASGPGADCRHAVRSAVDRAGGRHGPRMRGVELGG